MLARRAIVPVAFRSGSGTSLSLVPLGTCPSSIMSRGPGGQSVSRLVLDRGGTAAGSDSISWS
jgi:hypothetical protein